VVYPLIEFVSDNEVHHVSYWQVISGSTDSSFIVSNMGIYEDVIVKKNGQ
jgi:hypothetical protein